MWVIWVALININYAGEKKLALPLHSIINNRHHCGRHHHHHHQCCRKISWSIQWKDQKYLKEKRMQTKDNTKYTSLLLVKTINILSEIRQKKKFDSILLLWFHIVCLLFCYTEKGFQTKMDPMKMETMESSSSNKKSVINQMSTHVWNLFAKTNLFALCCVGAFLSLVRIIWIDYFFFSFPMPKKNIFFCAHLFQVDRKISRNLCGLRPDTIYH